MRARRSLSGASSPSIALPARFSGNPWSYSYCILLIKRKVRGALHRMRALAPLTTVPDVFCFTAVEAATAEQSPTRGATEAERKKCIKEVTDK